MSAKQWNEPNTTESLGTKGMILPTQANKQLLATPTNWDDQAATFSELLTEWLRNPG